MNTTSPSCTRTGHCRGRVGRERLLVLLFGSLPGVGVTWPPMTLPRNQSSLRGQSLYLPYTRPHSYHCLSKRADLGVWRMGLYIYTWPPHSPPSANAHNVRGGKIDLGRWLGSVRSHSATWLGYCLVCRLRPWCDQGSWYCCTPTWHFHACLARDKTSQSDRTKKSKRMSDAEILTCSGWTVLLKEGFVLRGAYLTCSWLILSNVASYGKHTCSN